MTKKLFIQAIIKFIIRFIAIASMVFLPVGTLNYFNGWLFTGILFIPIFIVGVVLIIINPNLLEKN